MLAFRQAKGFELLKKIYTRRMLLSVVRNAELRSVLDVLTQMAPIVRRDESCGWAARPVFANILFCCNDPSAPAHFSWTYEVARHRRGTRMGLCIPPRPTKL